MASADSTTVVVDRALFEILIRRANLHTGIFDKNDHVLVTREELNALQLTARKYENLVRHLTRGGIDKPTLDLLSQDETTTQAGHFPEQGGANPAVQGTTPGFAQRQRTADGDGNGQMASNNRLASGHGGSLTSADSDQDDISSEEGTSLSSPVEPDYVSQPNHKPQPNQDPQPNRESQLNYGLQPIHDGSYELRCLRTVELLNMAEGTTHADITAAVRGGFLLDISIYSHGHSARVSFLHNSDALRFIDRVRKHDLYVKCKRVDVKWHDRQFVLAGHVAAQIRKGASRNLVIRRVDARHTEASIRADLDHVHNLVIIKVSFVGGSCYIKTNSINLAMFARSCMISRAKYKGSKIEWDVDECAQPYSQVAQFKQPRKEASRAQKKTIVTTATANPFQPLSVRDDEEEEEDIAATSQSRNIAGVAA